MPGTRTESHDLRVVWQQPDTRRLCEVGRLSARRDPDRYTFTYVHPLPTAFTPFMAFPDPTHLYESDTLFPFFRNRVMTADRPGYEEYLATLGLTPEEASPFELLTRTGGRRETDRIQVVPTLTWSEGCAEQLFLVSGVRHVPGDIESILGDLTSGDELLLRDEHLNPVDPRAVLLDAEEGREIGWLPNYLLDEVHKIREAGEVRVQIERVNPPGTPWHLRVLCRLQVRC